MRKIPTSMATQHPDNAGKPYWHHRAYISTSEEIMESFLCFSKYNIDEYNWDWEGKFVDEAVTDRLLHKYLNYFTKFPMGKDKFLTFRIPNPRLEKQFRLARAFMVIITSSQLARSLGFSVPPIFETILPLTETAEEIIDIQKAFKDLTSLEHKLLNMGDSLKHIEIIPLFEQVSKIIDSDKLLRIYLKLHKKIFGYIPKYLRPYCARSDPALNSGLVSTMLAIKIALSSYKNIENEFNIKLYPMIGTGSLPFRGGITPYNVENKIKEYAGVSTFTIQSAYRYDYPLSVVKKSIEILKRKLPASKADTLTNLQIELIKKCIPNFEKPYRNTIEDIAFLINDISCKVAKRRERMLHIGLFGYSRGIGKVSLPRAIPFTASLYSLGIPPEFIGTGRGITAVKKIGAWDKIMPLYKDFKEDMITAGSYLCKDNLKMLANKYSYWQVVWDDVVKIEKECNLQLGPINMDQKKHEKISRKIYQNLKENKDISRLITHGGILRKSLG